MTDTNSESEPLTPEEFASLQAKVPDLDLTKPWDILTAYGRACDTRGAYGTPAFKGLGRPDCVSLILQWHHQQLEAKTPKLDGDLETKLRRDIGLQDWQIRDLTPLLEAKTKVTVEMDADARRSLGLFTEAEVEAKIETVYESVKAHKQLPLSEQLALDADEFYPDKNSAVWKIDPAKLLKYLEAKVADARVDELKKVNLWVLSAGLNNASNHKWYGFYRERKAHLTSTGNKEKV
jgi:hypothetical protein